MKTDKILATRTHKIIYKVGDTAVKVFDTNFPKADVLNEALNQARVETVDLPIPKVLGVNVTEEGHWSITSEYIEGKTMEQLMEEHPEKLERVETVDLPIPKVLGVNVTEEGHWSITSEYIEGKTMEQLMEEHPEKLEEYMKEFVALQLEVHSKRCPMLNKLKDKWDGKIAASKMINATTRYELRTRLSSMPKHDKVLHGDFNPSNIIITEKGEHYILDWSHATQGNASADAATTYLLFALKDQKLADLYMELFCEMSDTAKYILDWSHATQGNASADAATTYLLFALKDQKLADLYMELFCEMSDTAKQYVQRWLPITAASRLTKGIAEEKALLESWLDVVEYE